MTTSLARIWMFWEQAEKGWEQGKPEGKPHEGDEAPSASKPKTYEKPKTVVTTTKSPSGLGTIERPKTFVPGKDKDAKIMQLKTELAALEEQLILAELEESLITPDAGGGTLDSSLYFGGALEPANGYDRNFCPDPVAPEERGDNRSQDSAATLVAPKEFIPR